MKLLWTVIQPAATLAVALLVVTPASAAPISFQSAVLADSPHTFYRLNEAVGPAAADLSGNSNNGTYVNGPTLGAAGAGPASDDAVLLNGTNQYVDSTATSFGSLMDNSSFEFIFKVTTPFPTAKMSLAGVFNTGSTSAFQVNLNENAQGGTTAVPNSIRLFLRDESNIGLGAAFVHPTILDGEYHHLLFTYDSSAGASRVQAYVDGIVQTVTLGTGTAAGGTPTNFANFGFNPAFGARNVRGTVGFFFNGTLDEAAIYASTLTANNAARHNGAIPEPSTALLVTLGGVSAVLGRRRKNSA